MNDDRKPRFPNLASHLIGGALGLFIVVMLVLWFFWTHMAAIE